MKQKLKLNPIKIGKINIKNPIFLAPMVDVTDLPYRLICKKAGAGFAYTEMLYVDAIIHENPKTKQLMQTNKEDSPIGIQITGSDIENFKQAIPYLKKYNLVDINCGCPSSRITGNEAGSFLLKNPEKIYDIIKLLKSHNLTVTAKIRLGFKNNNVIEVAKLIEKAGADAITVHARLASHGNDVPADWQWIKKVKQSVSIPVIGNGDIVDGKSAKLMLEQTGCDAIMIGRASIGDPLIFKRISHYLKTGKEPGFSFKDNIAFYQEYLKLCKKYKMQDLARIKYIGSKFIKGIEGASKLRNQLMALKSIEEIEAFSKQLIK